MASLPCGKKVNKYKLKQLKLMTTKVDLVWSEKLLGKEIRAMLYETAIYTDITT